MADDYDFSSLFTSLQPSEISSEKFTAPKEYTDEDREITWGDYGRALGAGVLDIGAGLSAGTEYLSGGKYGGDARKYLNELADEQIGKTSLAFQRASNASFLPGEGEESVFDVGIGSAIAAKTARAAPSLVASFIPAGIAAKVLQGIGLASRAAIVAGTAKATGSVLNAGDVANQIYSEFDKLSDNELMNVDAYAGYRSMGMNEKEARRHFMEDVQGYAPIAAAAITYATGGLEGQLGARLGGAEAKGIIAGFKTGATKEFIQEAAESGSGAYFTQQKLADYGLKEVDWQNILAQTIEGGVVGGVLGGVGGGVGNIGGRGKATVEAVEPKGPSDEQTVALNSSMDLVNSTDVTAAGNAAKVTRDILDVGSKGGDAIATGKRRGKRGTKVPQSDPKVPTDAEALALNEINPSVNGQQGVVPNTPAPPSAPKPSIVQAATPAQQSTAPPMQPSAEGTETAPPLNVGQTVAEPVATLSAQFEDLVNPESDRSVVFIPKGTKNKPAIPAGLKSAAVGANNKGDPGGVYYYTPGSGLDYGTVVKAHNTGTAGELMNMSKTNKQQIAADIEKGAKPAAIVARNAAGTPVVEASTTTATLPSDLANISGGAAPGTTVEVSTPEAVLNERNQATSTEATKANETLDRIARQKAARLAATAAPTVTTEVTPSSESTPAKRGRKSNETKLLEQFASAESKPRTSITGGRVLEAAQSPAELEEINRIAELEAEQVSAENAPPAKKETEARPNRVVARTKNNDIADVVVNEHAPAKEEDDVVSKDKFAAATARRLLVNRVRAMIAASEKAGFKMPARVKGQIDTRVEHNSSAVLLREAKDLIKSAKNPSNEQISDFLMKEKTLRGGYKEEVIAQRKAEGAQKSKPTQNIEEDAVGYNAATSNTEALTSEGMSPEELLIGKEEAEAEAKAESKAEAKANEDFKRTQIASVSKEETPPSVVGEDKGGTFVRNTRPKNETMRPSITGKISLAPKTETKPERLTIKVTSPAEPLNPNITQFLKSYAEGSTNGMRGNPDLKEVAEYADRIAKFTDEQWRKIGSTFTKSFNPFHNASGIDVEDSLAKLLQKIEGESSVRYMIASNKKSAPSAPTTKINNRPYTLSQAIARADLSNFDDFGIARKIVIKVLKRLDETIAKQNVKVYILSQSDIDPEQKGIQAYYSIANDAIFISEDLVINGKIDAHVLAHEGLHAMMEHAISLDPELRRTLEALANHAYNWVKNIEDSGGFSNISTDDYGFSRDDKGKINIHEFLSEALSNPEFMNQLSEIRISKKDSAYFGIDDNISNPTVWDGIVSMVTNYLRRLFGRNGFDTSGTEYNILSAVMKTISRYDTLNPNTNFALQAREAFYGKGTANNNVRPLIGKKGEELLSKVSGTNINSRSFGRTVQRATDTMAMLARRANALGESFGKAASKVDEFVQRMDRARSKLLERVGGGLEIAREGDTLRRKYGDKQFSDMTDVMFRASELNVNLAMAGDVADNSHLGKDAIGGWQGKAQVDALEAKFRAMPKDLQQWAMKAVKFGRDEQNMRSLETIKVVLKGAGINEPGLAERIHQDGVTEADYDKFKTDKIITHLDRISNLKQMQGWYVPFMRKGDYVVQAKAAVAEPTGKNVTKVNDNTFVFTDPTGKDGNMGARRAAESFLGANKQLNKKTKKIFVDKRNPTVRLPSEDINAIPAYEVQIQNDHFELFESESEARNRASELETEGYKDVVTDLLQQNPNGRWGGVMPSQYETVIRSLTSRDSFKGLSSSQQNSVIQAMHEANIRLLPGTRIQQTELKRKNVGGYSRDIVRSMSRYAEMSAGYRARLQYQPEIDSALKDMEGYIKANPDDRSIQRREILREMENRVHGNAQPRSESRLAEASQTLRTVSMLDKLAGVSFHVINSMEPWTTSLPYIGGRHGATKTVGALKNAYNLIGARSGLFSGIADTFRAFNQNTGFTDYVATFKQEIAKNATGERAKRLTSVLDYLDATNLLGSEAGMEMNRLTNTGQGLLGRGLSRAELMARQVGTTIEAINRSTTGLAAYELEYERTGNHEKSLAYARDTVDITMGNYAASNASPMFNHPLWSTVLQFKKFAQKTYYLIGKTAAGALRGDREAQKQFVGIMFTHAIVAGLLGLPLEPIKIALLLSNALGLTDYTYADFEENVRTAIKNIVGAKGAEIATRGLPRAFGIDVSSRLGLSDLLTFSTPQSMKANDMKSWLFDTMAGAPAGLILQQLEGARALMDGDVGKFIEKSVPIKGVRDITQAVTRTMDSQKSKFGNETMSPYTAYETGLRAIGFKPSREAETQEMRRIVGGETFDYTAKRGELVRSWVNASEKNRGKEMIAIERFNRGLPKQAQISRDDLRKAEKSKRTQAESGNTVKGIRFNKRTGYLKDQMGVYNVD